MHKIHEKDKKRHNEEMNLMSSGFHDLGLKICAIHLNNQKKQRKKIRKKRG
jgi:hypothetical protein